MDPERLQRVESIFQKALDAGEDRRARVLVESCAGDESLRREVESLLAQHEVAGDFLERPAFAGFAGATLPPRPGSADAHSAGTVIGHYRIVGKIGSGGMGVVYEAEDLRLRRRVALKFLPQDVAGQPRVLQRFRLEAQAASALNHPNICTIHEVDEVDGLVFIVMELLEGRTLKETLSGKPLALETVIDFGVQIAGAINAAHAKGVVHRDIKPANIFVMKQRRVKVLDFGLAKLTRLSPNSGETGMMDRTEPGTVMGTIGYMSPEQVRGQGVDGRTDIFAFGAILYEMLTGRRAFEKPTSAETMAAVLDAEPPAVSELAPNTPPALVRIVKRCLEKDTEQRFQSASDLAFALAALSESSGAITSAGVKHHSPRRIWAAAVISAALIVVALVLWKMVLRPQRAPRVLSFAKLTNDGQPKFGPMVTDGSRIYFDEGTPGGQALIHQVSVKGGEVTMLPLPLNAPWVLDLSRDATELLVANYEVPGEGNSYWVAPVAGGAPRQVGTVLGQAAAFGADGTNVIYNKETGYVVTTDLYSVSRDGSASRKLLATDGLASGFRFSPDGSRLRFTLENRVANTSTVVEAASNGSGLVKMFDGCCGEWTPDGRFFTFQRSLDGRSNIWALPERRRLWRTASERPTPLTAGPLDFEYPLPSKDGRQIFAIATSQRGEVVRYDAGSGDFVPYLPGISAEALAFSPDGKWVTYTTYPEGTLWRSKVDGTERLQLTFPPMQAFLPRWSPDRKEIVFSAKLPDTLWNIYLISSEGGTPERLQSEHNQMDANWSPDGNSLVFAPIDNPDAPIYTMDLRTKRVSALSGSSGLYSTHWSPDGRFITALKDDSNALMIFDFTTREWTEAFPFWVGYETFSHDGKYVYFLNYQARDLKPRVLRLRMSDRKIEEVVDLQKAGPLLNGRSATWFGLAPDDSPLVTRDISTQEVYALEMDWP
jgi:serine/threonine protein kinase/Tol biopolymer transport system component